MCPNSSLSTSCFPLTDTLLLLCFSSFIISCLKELTSVKRKIQSSPLPELYVGFLYNFHLSFVLRILMRCEKLDDSRLSLLSSHSFYLFIYLFIYLLHSHNIEQHSSYFTPFPVLSL
jgi:hypothetical protein